MTQPLGNCPGCGADEPFEQIHPGACPDMAGECPEWACVACGTGVFMGTIITGTIGVGLSSGALTPVVAARASARAA